MLSSWLVGLPPGGVEAMREKRKTVLEFWFNNDGDKGNGDGYGKRILRE